MQISTVAYLVELCQKHEFVRKIIDNKLFFLPKLGGT